ncbi:MAG TPA: class I tRNA ligase family protein [Candidatus Paceibacterota bacterium]|nr:class I tRNA ligase family protein [Candidatus Paceibacterota bacterium]
MHDLKEREERVLKFWDENRVFERSMKQRLGKEPFVFFEGPPTANGSPGIHHFMGRVFKDLFCRYQTMKGRYVLRKGGWDTHGLPVELQVEKELGFTNKKDIERYGVAAYNKKCRESVWKYRTEWERFTKRIGFWLDLGDPYVTYETPYIESLWNIISRIAKKDLLYQAHRVVPFCTRCGTPLSSHEVNLGYKKITENSVYLKFRVTKTPRGLDLPDNTFILAWTTTPWTLPGNVALAVGPGVRYVLVPKDGVHYILAEDLAHKLLGAPLAIERTLTGADLVGIAYEPLFAVRALKKPRSYQVYPADFVTTTDGTGVVHTAVMYGEDDYRLGDAIGLVKKHTVTERGTFIGVSKELDGRYVKDAQTEQLILTHLQEKGFLLTQVPYEHDYPFCWRCDTPLLYYAKDSWFVRMSAVNKEILANNDTINWVPSHLRDGRFGQWLKEAKDWGFSRERYWGTPLPVWMARDRHDKPTGEPLVISSMEDLDTYRADKPATFWVMRHGESESNVKHLIDAGEEALSLTAKGEEQAMQAARDLKAKLVRSKIRITAVVSSPVLRTKQTANIAAKELGVPHVSVNKELREIELGPALRDCHDTAYHTQYPTYESKFTQRPPGGELLTDLRERMWHALQELNTKYAGKHVLLVGHEYPIWMLVDAANGWSMRQSIAEKERRGKDFVTFAQVEQVVVRNLPRDEHGVVDLHRPYVDEVVLKRPNSRTPLYRVPDLVDVWFDSGSMPFAQWHWPFENEDVSKVQFPADFIAEGIDQTRGWFYTLLAVSTLLGKGAPFRNVLSLELVLDEKGQKMSKSRGNIVKPDDVIDAVGADAARWYFYAVNKPDDPKLFSLKEARERLTGFMMTLENCVRFWELYKDDPAARSFSHGNMPTHRLDVWLLSRLHRVMKEVTDRLDEYDPTGAARALEQFVVDDLSQWWLRRSRKRTSALGVLRHVLLEVGKLVAPFVPFAAEDHHQRLHAGTAPGTLSVHMHDWPRADAKQIDEELEEHMAKVREWVSAGLAIRKQEGVRVRQPLASATVPGPELEPDLANLLREELNVKEVRYAAGQPVGLDPNISPALRREGWVRELMRAVQDMRKEAGLKVGQQAFCQWHTDHAELAEALEAAGDDFKRETTLEQFLRRPDDDQTSYTVEKNIELQPDTNVWVGLRM